MMLMDRAEILKSYNDAKFPQKQISILADMNLCKYEEMVDYLVKNGAEDAEHYRRKSRHNIKREMEGKLTEAVENRIRADERERVLRSLEIDDPYWHKVTAVAKRQRKKGIGEYGDGIENFDAGIDRIIEMAIEEIVDAAYYATHALQKYKAKYKK